MRSKLLMAAAMAGIIALVIREMPAIRRELRIVRM
jgi:hypothetical protein